MKTQKAVDTHNAIVDAARELFLEKSVSKVTISDITRRAGVAKGTFYVYFESKDELVWHFMEHEFLPLFDWFDAFKYLGHETEEIDRMVDFLISYVQKNKRILKMMHQVRFLSFLGRENMERKYTNQMYEPVYTWLESGKKQGKVDILDSSIAAYYLIIGIHEIIDRTVVGELDINLEDLGENLKYLLKKTLK